MKHRYTVFTCDMCETQSGVRASDGHVHSPTQDEQSAITFPYREGWVYVKELSTQFHNGETLRRHQGADLHFCSKTCLVAWLQRGLTQ